MRSIETKKCSICKDTYPNTREYFYKNSNRSVKGDNLRSYCKKCAIKMSLKRYNLKTKPIKYKCVIEKHTQEAKKRGQKPTLTYLEWLETLNYFNNECAYCGKSNVELTQDHLIPASRGGEYKKGNIIPCCKSCNSSKYNKDFLFWYVSRSFYSEERYFKVINFYIDNIRGRLET